MGGSRDGLCRSNRFVETFRGRGAREETLMFCARGATEAQGVFPCADGTTPGGGMPGDGRAADKLSRSAQNRLALGSVYPYRLQCWTARAA